MKLTMTFLLCCLMVSALSAATLSGNVADATTGEELIGANISVFKNGEFRTGASTDFDGAYHLKLDCGTYDIEITYMGFETVKLEDVILLADAQKELMIELVPGIALKEIVITEFKLPNIRTCFTTCGGNICSSTDKQTEVKEEKKPDTDFTINYYPNPTTDILHIDLGQATKSISIRSMDGKELLRRSNLQSGIVDLDVSDYPAGTYILQVVGEEFLISKKFIVLRD